MSAIIIITAVAISIALWYIITDNRFRCVQTRIEEDRSCVETALTRRSDALTSLLATAKSCVKQGPEPHVQAVRLHEGMNAAEMTEANRQLDVMAIQIQAAAEAYPKLRSNEAFSDLQRSVADAEEHLQKARKLYNSDVIRFNTMKAVFPSGIIGRKYGEYGFFQAEEHRRVDMEIL